MPDKNPFAPSSKLAFLTGLTGSLSGYMKEQGDRVRKEDDDKRKMDYELLMASLEHLKPNLTPSQAKEILTRAVDISKPKKANSIKESLGELFGTGPRYEGQSGKIVNEATSKPRVQVDLEPDPNDAPSVFGSGDNQITLPPPPTKPVYEKTYGEQELADKEQLIEAQTNKALDVEDRRQTNRLEAIKVRNQEGMQRFMQEQGMRDEAAATKMVRERASFFGDPDDPSNQERARTSLQGELAQKKELANSRIDYNKRRLEQIDKSLSLAEQRVQVAVKKLSAGKQANWNNDPQVKGAWAKVAQYKEQAKTLRTQAAIAYSKGDLGTADLLNEEAAKSEAVMQGVVDNIEQRVNSLSGGISLPNPPRKSGAAKKGGVKLTEAEIRAAGGSNADVQDARRRGVLAP